MPKSQNGYIRKENPIKPEYSPWHTMGNNLGRSNQPITWIKRKKCHNGHSRPILKNDSAIPDINWNNLPRHGKDLQGWDLQITQHSKEGDLRSRSTVCFVVHEGTILPTSNRRESLYRLSPRNRWTNQKNQCMVEQYLCIYINHRQSDWIEWLSITEFAHNQTSSSATTFSPFLLNYGQQLQSGFAQKGKERNLVANEFVEEMKSTQQITKSALKMASYNMKRFHDQKVWPPVEYKPGDLVLLEATNIKTEQPSKKLDNKQYSPSKVIKKEGLASYCLKLDKLWRQIHPIFHKCLLHPYHQGDFPSQK